MPCYEYRCRSNGRTLEVRHGMSEHVETWGELALKAGADVGDTPSDAPVERLMSVPAPPAASSGRPEFQGCGQGCACAREA